MNIILASTSPRRRELLSLLGVSFEIIPPTCDELLSADLSPSAQAKQLALDKAESVALHHQDHLVLGSDTVIEIDNALLGKPGDMTEAETMLRQLRGHCHNVHTGIALIHKATGLSVASIETAKVWIKPFTEKALQHYLDTQESLGKAGAYSIQGQGANLIEKIEGDYPTIVGLPLWRVGKLFEEQGVRLGNSIEEIYRVRPYANWKDFS